MSLIALGANHKTVPLSLLERVSLGASEVETALRELTAATGVNGAVILSTCNRMEAYVDAQTDRMGAAALEALCLERLGEDELPQGFFFERSESTARHLFRVVCSLDSQVLGESQILGQVKAAYEQAREAGTCTEPLTRLFKDAVRLGKRVRSETGIGADSVSLSTAAVKAAKSQFDDIASCRVLFIGSGEMARLAFTYLLEDGVRDFTVTSRTQAHAQQLARLSEGARTCAFEDLHEALAHADIAFSMTASSVPVVEARALERARELAGAQERKLVIVDEAVPRDVDPACADLPGVTLYDMEALASVVDAGLAGRLAAVGDVERMVAEAQDEFGAWMQQRSVAPTVKEMYLKGARVVQDEVEHAARSLSALRGEELGQEERKILEALGSAVMKKLLHGPANRLRLESGTADSYYYTSAARYLFGLDAFPEGFAHGNPHIGHDTSGGVKQ